MLLSKAMYSIDLSTNNTKSVLKLVKEIALVKNPVSIITYIIGKKFQHKCGHTAIDPNEQINTSQHYISCTGDLEQKGSWVHQWGYGPSVR